METQGAACTAAAADCNCNLSDGKWQIAPLIISNQLRQKTDMEACKHNYNDILGGRGTAMEHIWGFHESSADWVNRSAAGLWSVFFPPSHVRLFKFRCHRATCLPSNGAARLTCAGHRRRVRECSVVAVLAVAAPGSLAVVKAVRRTARALKVLGGRLVETTTARCGRGEKKENEAKAKRGENSVRSCLHRQYYVGLLCNLSVTSKSPHNEIC